MTFKTFYHLREAKFRESKKVEHLYDLPMFSIFIKEDLLSNPEFIDEEIKILVNTKRVRNMFKEARNIITKLGFPSMHANVLFEDLSKDINPHTNIEGGVGGYAHKQGKYMSLDLSTLTTNLIVHEWAHLWMFNNTKAFKSAVKEYYKHLQDSPLKDELGSYAMANDEELWATGIEEFLRFPPEHQKSILRLCL